MNPPRLDSIPPYLRAIFSENGEVEGPFSRTELEDTVDALLRDYYNRSRISSGVPHSALADHFRAWKIPEMPEDLEHYARFLREVIVEHSMKVGSPAFVGHMTAALPGFMVPFARLMTALNQNTVKLETSNALTFCERETLANLHELFFENPVDFYETHIQHPESTLGVMTSGGTTANLTALWCARNFRFRAEKEFPGIERAGLAFALERHGYRGAAIVGSELMHYSFEKSADLLGIGVDNLIKVPTDSDFRVNTEALRKKIESLNRERIAVLAIVGVAGTTDAGSVDDLRELGSIARDNAVHFHVDAAWGGPVRFCEQWKHLLDGIEQADSITVDGHKQLFVPMGSGTVLFRDPTLARSIEKSAAYVIRKDSPDLGRRSLEGSRPAMSLLVHAALHLIGRQGYDRLIADGIRKTKQFVEILRNNDRFELLHEPMTNIVLYRYLPEAFRAAARAGGLPAENNRIVNTFNERLQSELNGRGESFVSRTTVPDRRWSASAPVPTAALRLVLSNPLSDEEDLRRVIRHQERIAAEMEVGEG